jgi:competence protein ComEA
MLKKILAVVAMLYAAVAMAAVDVNKATEAQLDGVKGIGPGTSKMILDERKKGEFKDWADFIARVKGVAEARAANLSEAGLTVNGKAYKATTAKADDKAAKKDEKKDDKAAKKDEKKDEKAARKDDKAAAAKPAASAPAAKPASAAAAPAAAAKPAASAKK